jgi:hypothetical protein
MRRFAGVAVLAATCFVVFAQPAFATYPGRNGRISFRRLIGHSLVRLSPRGWWR